MRAHPTDGYGARMVKRTGYSTFMVEHYWPGVTEADFRRSAQLVADSAQRMALAGEPIRFLHSTLVPNDEAAFCVLAAASAELVEEAYAAAGVAFERLVGAVESDVHPDRGRRGRSEQARVPSGGTEQPRGRTGPGRASVDGSA
jgi:hypothetical protein